MFHRLAITTCLCLLSTLTSCLPADEAPRVRLPVVVDPLEDHQLTNNLGYAIELQNARLALGSIAFTTRGELHARCTLIEKMSDLIIPTAHAHPGHDQGGEVIGELPGEFIADWMSDARQNLGPAELIVGDYSAADFTFLQTTSDMVDSPQDSLIEHTIMLSGEAKKDGQTTIFTILIQAPENRSLVGAIFDADINTDASGVIRFDFLPTLTERTIFDDLDFSALDTDQDGVWMLTPDLENDTYTSLRRALLSHDYYTFTYLPSKKNP